MKKIIIIFIGLCIAFAAGWILSYGCNKPKTVIIEKEKIVYNTITKNINQMTPTEIAAALGCYYTSIPGLDILHLEGDQYRLDASLCERKWSREVTIKIPQVEYKNMVIGGVFYDSELRPGAFAQYYRMYGRIGFGGGIAVTPGYANVSVGAAYRF